MAGSLALDSPAAIEGIAPQTRSQPLLRICDIVQFHSPISGGIRRYIEDKARYLATCPNVVHAVLIPGPDSRTWWEGRTRWIQIASPRMPGSKSYRLLLDRGGLNRFLNDLRPNVIEVADPYQTAWTALRWARRHGASVALYYHCDAFRSCHHALSKRFGSLAASLVHRVVGTYLHQLHNQADALLVATEKYQRLWQSRISTPVWRIPLGFDEGVFYPRVESRSLRDELGVGENEYLLIFAGRLAREKKLFELLHGFEHLRRHRRDCHLVIVGDGEEQDALRSHAGLHNLPVHWIGFKRDRAELAVCYSAADAFVHPGTRETYGLSVLEAAACGTPSVVFMGSGLEEASRSHPASRVISHRHPADLADGIHSTLSKQPSFESRWNIHHRLSTVMSTRATLQKLLSCYEVLVDQRSAASSKHLSVAH